MAGKKTRKRISKKRKKPTSISVRRSSGRKEKFNIDRMAKTTSRAGVPFLMARDIAKKVTKKLKSEAKDKRQKTVTAGRMRKMVASELRERNKGAIASSYSHNSPRNTQREIMQKVRPHEPPIGSADTDQHIVYSANRNSVLHNRSKRLASSA